MRKRYAHLDLDPEKSARIDAYLTVRMTIQAGMKVGPSDLVTPSGRVIT